MSREAEFHRLLTEHALDPAARGLMDDAAVLTGVQGDLVLTHDTLVMGVHCRLDDPPESVGWKLAAMNLSDLAAKGAEPLACLLSYPLAEDPAWDRAFLAGLRSCLDKYVMPLIGGDTIGLPPNSARVFGLTAIGRAPSGGSPSRAGGRPGDTLFVSGPGGGSRWGLELLDRGETGPAEPIAAYRFPVPAVAVGRAIAGQVHAMMDVSDGLLIDAARLAAASGCGVTISDVPVSPHWAAAHGRSPDALMRAATGGDDYVLLFAATERPAAAADALRVGRLEREPGLRLMLDGQAVALPDRLGWEH